MRIVKWIAIGCFALWLGCGIVGVAEFFANRQTWIVRVPAESVTGPGAIERVRESLIKRATGLMIHGSAKAEFLGEGRFSVDLSAPRRSKEMIEQTLTDSRMLSIRSPNPSTPAQSACDPVAPVVLQPAGGVDATMQFVGNGDPAVNVRFDSSDGETLRAFTRNNRGGMLAACLDGRVLALARIDSELGSYVTFGGFSSPEEALVVAAIVNGGPVPVGTVAERPNLDESAVAADTD